MIADSRSGVNPPGLGPQRDGGVLRYTTLADLNAQNHHS